MPAIAGRRNEVLLEGVLSASAGWQSSSNISHTLFQWCRDEDETRSVTHQMPSDACLVHGAQSAQFCGISHHRQALIRAGSSHLKCEVLVVQRKSCKTRQLQLDIVDHTWDHTIEQET